MAGLPVLTWLGFPIAQDPRSRAMWP